MADEAHTITELDENNLEHMVMALMMHHEIGDPDIPHMEQCGCPSCLLMVCLYKIVRPKLLPFLLGNASAAVH